MNTKICLRCKNEKEIDSFSKDISKKDHKSIYCKRCVGLYRSQALLLSATVNDLIEIFDRIMAMTNDTADVSSRFVIDSTYINAIEKQSTPLASDQKYLFMPFTVPAKVIEGSYSIKTMKSKAWA